MVFTAASAATYASGGPLRGVNGSGWRGDSQWREYVKIVGKGGTIEKLGESIPTKEEAIALIEESGGKVLRIEGPHSGLNPHTYNHINFLTKEGLKGTIQIQ